MRNIFSIITLACAATFMLSACDNSEQVPVAPTVAPPVAIVLHAPTLAAPIAPVKPAELASAEPAATAPSIVGGEPATVTTTKPEAAPLDPASAEIKTKYDAAMAQYEAEKKSYATAWKQYLVSVVTANMEGVKSNHPYMYFVPGGTDEVATADLKHQLENVTNIVQRGVLPGNLMAFGGPDSTITAQLVTDAFKEVQPAAFKDVVVLFIGAQTDAGTVKQALASSGADFRFVEAK